MKTKLFLTLVALIMTSGAYAGYTVTAKQLSTEPALIGTTDISTIAEYTLTVTGQRFLIMDAEITNKPNNLIILDNKCDNSTPSKKCTITVGLKPVEIQEDPTNFIAKFTINNIPVSNSSSIILPAVNNSVFIDATISLGAVNVATAPMTINYHFKNAETRLKQIDQITVPSSKILSNTCTNLQQGTTCDVSLLVDPTLSDYGNLPEPVIYYQDLKYKTMTNIVLANTQMMRSHNNNLVALTNNGARNNRLLLQSADHGKTWKLINMDFSIIPKNYPVDNLSFPGLVDVYPTDKKIIARNIWLYINRQQQPDWTGGILQKDIGNNNAWTDLGTPDLYPMSIVAYSYKDTERLFVLGMEGLFTKNLSQTGAPYVEVIHSINYNGNLVFSPATQKIYSITDEIRGVWIREGDITTDLTNPNNWKVVFLEWSLDEVPPLVGQDKNVFILRKGQVHVMPENPNRDTPWPMLNLPANSTSVIAVSANDDALFIATNNAAQPLYQSVDAGKTWTEIQLPKGAVGPLRTITAIKNDNFNALNIIDSNNNPFMIEFK